jgi:transcriptional regulator with XRE-family HTH domain
MAEPPTLGSRLKALREARRLSLTEAAKQTGLTTSFLAFVEADEFVPTEWMLLRITNTFDIDPHELLALREQARRPDDD